MRLLVVPVLTLALGATAVVVPSHAEGDATVRQPPVALEGSGFKPVASTGLPAAAAKRVAVVNAGDQLATATGRPASPDGALRGSVLMLLLQGLCCR